jgi:hypothetical protein
MSDTAWCQFGLLLQCVQVHYCGVGVNNDDMEVIRKVDIRMNYQFLK